MHQVLEDLVQPAIIGLFGFIVWFLKGLVGSVKELNERMAICVEKVTAIVGHLEDHEDRLRELESDSRH